LICMDMTLLAESRRTLAWVNGVSWGRGCDLCTVRLPGTRPRALARQASLRWSIITALACARDAFPRNIVRSGGLLFSCRCGLGGDADAPARTGKAVVPEITPAVAAMTAMRRSATAVRWVRTDLHAHANTLALGFIAFPSALCPVGRSHDMRCYQVITKHVKTP
jgi:hypothetical protein